MKRPTLNEIPLNEAINSLIAGKPHCCMTMSVGQWDALLQDAYDRGWNLLELDYDEIPVKAYRRKVEA